MARHLLQNRSPGLMTFPQPRQVRTPPLAAATGGGGGGIGLPAAVNVCPQDPQNRVLLPIGAPQAEQDGAGGGGGCAITGATGVTGATGAAVTAELPGVFAPQFPQNFSSGKREVPQFLQTFEANDVLVTGGGNVGASSIWEAPQFRQNFAFGATVFPHSGQNGMINHVP